MTEVIKNNYFLKWAFEGKYYPPGKFKEYRSEYIVFRKNYKHCFNCKKFVKKDICKNVAKAYFCPDCYEYIDNYRKKVDKKRKETCLKKYGVDSISKLDSVKKNKDAKLKNKSPDELNKIKEKSKQTQIEKYGMLYSQTKEYKDKIKKTSLEKYGYDSPNKCPRIKELQIKNQKEALKTGKRALKLQETCLKKYGTKWYQSTKEFKDKYQKAIDAKFGVINGDATSLLKYSEIKNGVYVFDKLKISEEYNASTYRIRRILNKLGINWRFKQNKSSQESDFLDSVETYIKILRQYKIKLNDKIYVADGASLSSGIIFEFLGDYWHGNPNVFNENDLNLRCKIPFKQLYNETIMRFENLSKLGYEIFYIWESDWEAFGLKGLKRFDPKLDRI